MIVKIYPPDLEAKYQNELFFYTQYASFAPKLLYHGKDATAIWKFTPKNICRGLTS